jgi:Fe-S oxidoreductase
MWESVECANVPGTKADFASFIRDARAEAFAEGLGDIPVYGGVLRTLGRMMADSRPGQNRLDWITGDMQVSRKGNVALFVGDLPYYEEIFANEIGYHPLDTARGAVRLLNAIGIKPVLIKDEVSPGYDELWSGDVETFEKLARKNIRAIARTGAKKIVTLDAESTFMLKTEYRTRFREFRKPVLHITQVLAPKLKSLKFRKIEERAAYHDPCRLGRELKVHDEPRKLLRALLENAIVRTQHERGKTLCTAAHRFSNFGAVAKLMQLDVLQEAENAGAGLLVTSCPREAIKLRLATRSESWKQTNIEVMELTSLAAGLYIPE